MIEQKIFFFEKRGVGNIKKYVFLFFIFAFIICIFLFKEILIGFVSAGFDELRGFDSSELKMKELYGEYEKNKCDVNNFSCQISKRCACLSDEDFEDFDNGKIIELDYCGIGEYCYDKQTGCSINGGRGDGLVRCYRTNKNFELAELCPENKIIEKNYCYCFNKETLEVGKDYYDLTEHRVLNLRENFRAIIDNGIRDYNYVRILPHVEVCTKGQKCEFGVEGGKGCHNS